MDICTLDGQPSAFGGRPLNDDVPQSSVKERQGCNVRLYASEATEAVWNSFPKS